MGGDIVKTKFGIFKVCTWHEIGPQGLTSHRNPAGCRWLCEAVVVVVETKENGQGVSFGSSARYYPAFPYQRVNELESPGNISCPNKNFRRPHFAPCYPAAMLVYWPPKPFRDFLSHW